MKLDGHRVFITGGSAGIGLALAQALVERGNRVLICGRDAERLAEARKQLGDVETIQADLADLDSLPQLASAAIDRLGGLSILVNNAGVQYNDVFGETQRVLLGEHVVNEISTNLTALVLLTANCMQALKQNDEAAVINIGSSLALAPKSSAPVYCATKAAVHSFSQSLRQQFRQSSSVVKVLEVLPPMVDTNMTHARTGKKLSPAYIAERTIAALARDRDEIYIGKARWLRLANRLSPSLVTALMRNR